MVIGIFYFSGTGNTEIVANLLENEFKNRGFEVEIIRIEDILKEKTQVDIEKYDMVGMGYPVHAFNAPRIFFDFIKKLPRAKNKKTFIFKTSGDPMLNAGATVMVRNRLKSKGYDVFYEKLMVMPSNVLVRYCDDLVKQLYLVAANRVKKLVNDVISGKINLQKNGIFLRTFTRVFSGGESLGARFFGKGLEVSEFCILCSKCINNCPTGNISISEKNKIKFGWNCILCMRCIYNCPQRAISPRFLKFFVLKDWYDINRIINDPELKGNYVSEKTKGYFRSFKRYMNEE